MSNSARGCIILVRDRACPLNGKTLKAAGVCIPCSFSDAFKFKKQATSYVFIKIDLVLLRSSFYFTRRRLPLSQLSPGKDFAAKEILNLNSFLLWQVSVLGPFLCSYQLWTDEKHLAEYLSWAISRLPPLFLCLLGAEFPLHAEKQRALKNAVATPHHFSTACAEKSILVTTVMLLWLLGTFLCKSTCFLEKSGMLKSMPSQESPDALLLHSHAAFRFLMLSYENTHTGTLSWYSIYFFCKAPCCES